MTDPNEPIEPTIRLRVNIPVTLASKLEMLLRDPVRPGKRIYGGLSRLATQLLTDYFEKLERNARSPTAESDEEECR